jgi:hypothetical protein
MTTPIIAPAPPARTCSTARSAGSAGGAPVVTSALSCTCGTDDEIKGTVGESQSRFADVIMNDQCAR